MSAWNPALYLRFSAERTQPCRDLAGRVELAAPASIADLGCGPGNSTGVLAARWPHAAITGVDSSPDMIAAARAARPEACWEKSDITAWAAGTEQFDLVFSNAALQWVDDHAALVPRLLARVAPEGALAFQIPANPAALQHRILREMAVRPVREWHADPPSFYYDALAPASARIEMWTTTYYHSLRGVEAIVEWYKATGMRPYLEALPDEAERARFAAEFCERLRPHFPPQPDGTVLFPFERLFLVAYR